ncbi:hypothetical protein J6590_070182 [Homalodisca vitripennis]|nr:hypothetical protein J6590_070182 [Homalodisca vitripennis]
MKTLKSKTYARKQGESLRHQNIKKPRHSAAKETHHNSHVPTRQPRNPTDDNSTFVIAGGL